MKRQLFVIIAGVSALFMANGLIAGEETLVKWSADAKTLQKEWRGRIKYEELDGKLCAAAVVDNRSYITTKKFIPVEAGKKYTLSGTFKSLGNEISRVYSGTAFVKIVILPNYAKKKYEKMAFTDLNLKVSE